MQIANSYNEFVEKITNALKEKLNTEQGEKITKELLRMKLKQNPNLTVEEWQKAKQELLTFLFLLTVRNVPEVAQEMSGHVWRELNG